MEHLSNNVKEKKTKQLVRLARAIYLLTTYENDPKALKLLWEVALSAGAVIDEEGGDKDIGKIIHPDLGFELAEYVNFKEYSKNHANFDQHISQGKLVDDMIKNMERRII